MKRPSFQFYPGDWLANGNLRRCSDAEQGVWVRVLCVLHDQDEYGVARWPLKELAQAACTTTSTLKSLVKKGVLKGAEAGEQVESLVHVPRHARQDGDPVTLIAAQEGPLWYSSRLVRDEYVRTIKAKAGAKGGGAGDAPNDAPNTSPMPPIGEGNGEGIGPCARGRSSSSSSSASTKTNSVTDVTGASAPPPETSAKDLIFAVGVPWMVERGSTDKNARSLLGRMRSVLGDGETWTLVQAAIADEVGEPAAWLAKALNGRVATGGGSPSKSRFDLSGMDYTPRTDGLPF